MGAVYITLPLGCVSVHGLKPHWCHTCMQNRKRRTRTLLSKEEFCYVGKTFQSLGANNEKLLFYYRVRVCFEGNHVTYEGGSSEMMSALR